jgi:MFS family permease
MLNFFGKQSSFRFLWFGQMFANLGDILYVVCLIKLIYDATGSVTYMSLVPFFNTLSSLVSSLFAPLIISKYKLKLILLYSQLGKTIFLLVLYFSVHYVEQNTLFFIYLLICLVSFLDGWAQPARNALVPSLVQDEKLVKTNSILAISDQVIQLISWPIGSVLLVKWGGENILLLTLIVYIISSVLMGLIKSSKDGQSKNDQTRLEVLKEGWMIIWHSKPLRTISIMNFLETFANGVWIAAILFVYVSEALNKGEDWWGYINASFFAGMLVSGLLILRLSNILERNLGKTMLFSTLSLIFVTLTFGMTSTPWLALFVSFLFGLPQMARDVAETTIIQKSARDELLAKVYSARGTLMLGAFGISSVLMGWITEKFGVRVTYMVSTALFTASFLVAVMNRKNLYKANKMKVRN